MMEDRPVSMGPTYGVVSDGNNPGSSEICHGMAYLECLSVAENRKFLLRVKI